MTDDERAASFTLPTHESEAHAGGTARLNWLRAGVLGSNDGIVSVAGIVVGVAGATAARGPIFTAGLAGLVAGAVSMALGEYVSVSSQRDSEHALMAQERRELHESPEDELAELTALYRAKGLSPATARQVAEELTDHDALGAHLGAELGIDPDDLANPRQAAAADSLPCGDTPTGRRSFPRGGTALRAHPALTGPVVGAAVSSARGRRPIRQRPRAQVASQSMGGGSRAASPARPPAATVRDAAGRSLG